MSEAELGDATAGPDWNRIGLLHVGPEPAAGVRWWEQRFGHIEAMAVCRDEGLATEARRSGVPALSATLEDLALDAVVPHVLVFEELDQCEDLNALERLLELAARAARDAMVIIHRARYAGERASATRPVASVGRVCQSLNRLGLAPYAFAPLRPHYATRPGPRHVVVVPTRPLGRDEWNDLFDVARAVPHDVPLEPLLAKKRSVSLVSTAGARRERYDRDDIAVSATHPAAPVLLPDPVSLSGAIADVSRLAHGYAAPPVTAGVVRGGAAVMSEGCVITARRELVLESASRLSFGRELAARRPGLVAELASAPQDPDPSPILVLPNPRRPSYYHWWLDCLPRIWIVDEHTSDGGCRLLAPPHLYDFELETLEMLGFGERVKHQQEPVVGYAELLLSPGLAWRDLPSPAIEDFVRWVRARTQTPLPPQSSGRIYVSRASARRRRVANEDEVCEGLAACGFETLELDGMPVRDQIALFSAAEAVVAPHGAGLTNLMFCRGGTHVVELFSVGGFHDSCYRRMAAICGQHYHAVVGPSATGTDELSRHGKRTHEDDMRIDVAALVRFAHDNLAAPVAHGG